MNAASAYVVPTQTSADCSLEWSTVPSGRMPLTAPIRPPANPHTFMRWIVLSAASTRSAGRRRSPSPVASAYHWPASWSAMMLSELAPPPSS